MFVFDQDIAIEPKGDSLYSGIVSDNWSINGIPNGGYLMALLTNAMLQESKNDDIVVVTASYPVLFMNRSLKRKGHLLRY